MVGGVTRSYIVHIPPGYDGSAPAPLVLNLHGGGTTGADAERYTGFDATADAHGFIVVYPNGVNNLWNDGRSGTREATAAADDIGFLNALVRELSSKTPVDAKRVYVTGISNGGHMTNLAVCRLADVFAAAASVAAPLSTEVKDGCKPSVPVAVLTLHGTADTYDPYGGGTSHFGPVISAQETFDFWGKIFSCTGLQTERLADADPSDGTTVSYTHATACGSPKVGVGLYTIEGGGHTWPDTSRSTRISERLLGKTTHDIGNEEIWAFFAAHGR